jgi:hypothetical protein
MQGKVTQDMFLLNRSSYINVACNNLITDIESLGRKKLGSVFSLVYLILPPNPFIRLIFHIVRVPGRLSYIKFVPQVLEFSFTDK